MINPKCENGCELFLTSRGTMRPCFWISEFSEERKIFDDNDNWNLNKTSFKKIVEVHLKEFIEDIKKNPLKVCVNECTEKHKD